MAFPRMQSNKEWKARRSAFCWKPLEDEESRGQQPWVQRGLGVSNKYTRVVPNMQCIPREDSHGRRVSRMAKKRRPRLAFDLANGCGEHDLVTPSTEYLLPVARADPVPRHHVTRHTALDTAHAAGIFARSHRPTTQAPQRITIRHPLGHFLLVARNRPGPKLPVIFVVRHLRLRALPRHRFPPASGESGTPPWFLSLSRLPFDAGLRPSGRALAPGHPEIRSSPPTMGSSEPNPSHLA